MTIVQELSAERRFGIAEIARRYGVSLRTLRFYEQQGLLRPMRAGHDRLYSARDETRLQVILKGKRLGFTLHEIGRLIGYEDAKRPAASAGLEYDDFLLALDGETIARQTAELERKKMEINSAIDELKASLERRVEYI